MGDEKDHNNNNDDENYNDKVDHQAINNNDEYDDWDTRKAFVSRIPSTFDADIVKRIIEKKIGEECVQDVSIVYAQEEEKGEEEKEKEKNDDDKDKNENNTLVEKTHRGFGFVTFISKSIKDEAIQSKTVRGGVKETSKRKHTIYLLPLDRSSGDATITTTEEEVETGGSSKNACHLWALKRCPYGDHCKFDHVGEGACCTNTTDAVLNRAEPLSKAERDKKKKCFSFKKKGKCKLGESCPFSHELVVKKKKTLVGDEKKEDKMENENEEKNNKNVNQKDCINWKTKGKCRKLNSPKGCPYRHDEAVRNSHNNKKNQKRQRIDNEETTTTNKKIKQPLSIRVFGMNYDTTEQDIRTFFEHCGPIVEVTFPTFEDSGRSKGYCGVLFQSPKAVEKALLLHEAELHGRWLSVQAGKMLLREWEEREKARFGGGNEEEKGEGEEREATKKEKEVQEVGEFGQKVKRRKKHGYKE